MKLSTTQQALLNRLKQIKAHAQATLAEAEAGALGGLSEREKIIRMSVAIDSDYVAGETIKGVRATTYARLRDLGLVDCVDGWWFAK
ncbi:MAG: hypothetical protein M0036_00065 [Desulfobacteraceae bacterium]|nr:hypothetical protein [Desulfobacteraceae bacterium]